MAFRFHAAATSSRSMPWTFWPRPTGCKAQGRPVISMAVGQPSDPAPTAVREAAAQALADGRIGYTDTLGLADLREAIAAHYADHYGLERRRRRGSP